MTDDAFRAKVLDRGGRKGRYVWAPNARVARGSSDWDNWRERIFQPTAIAVGMPRDTRPRDLRGSFASLLIYEGVDIVELAPELGHSLATCLRYYARVFEEFKGLPRCPAVDVIREARDAVAASAVPPRYLEEDPSGVGGIWHVRDTAQ